MRILVIGDPHGNIASLRKMPLKAADVILLTGDLGKADLARKLAFSRVRRAKAGKEPVEHSPALLKKAFMESYTSGLAVVRYLARFAPVYTIYGNVESTNTETDRYAKAIGRRLPHLTSALQRIRGVHVVNNRLRRIDKVRIGCLGFFTDDHWVQEFLPSAPPSRYAQAKRATKRAAAALKRFGPVDILLCHQPPYGVLDKVTASFAPKGWQGKHAGSKLIRDYIKRRKPTHVFCGHIHEGAGTKKMGKTIVHNLGDSRYYLLQV